MGCSLTVYRFFSQNESHNLTAFLPLQSSTAVLLSLWSCRYPYIKTIFKVLELSQYCNVMVMYSRINYWNHISLSEFIWFHKSYSIGGGHSSIRDTSSLQVTGLFPKCLFLPPSKNAFHFEGDY